MTEKTDLERARDIAVQLENDNARLEHELSDSRRVAEFYMQENGKNLAAVGRVRDFADELCAEGHPGHDHVCPDDVRKGLLAALDGAQQPGRDCPACEAGIDHTEHCPTPETHNWGCGCPTDNGTAPAVGEGDR